MIERTLYAHVPRNTFHLNGNFLIAGMTAATVGSWAALWASARLSSPEAITGMSTAIGGLTFVLLYFLLNYLHTAAAPDTAPVPLPLQMRRRQGIERVHVTGALRMGILLGLHVVTQAVLIRLGMRPDHACLVAYMLAHASSHAVYVLLLRGTGISRSISYSGQRTEPWQWQPGHAGSVAVNASAMERGAGGS